jgi:hypothetical protein
MPLHQPTVPRQHRRGRDDPMRPQPASTPTWIDLGIHDLDRAMEFYGAVFDWEFAVGPASTLPGIAEAIGLCPWPTERR